MQKSNKYGIFVLLIIFIQIICSCQINNPNLSNNTVKSDKNENTSFKGYELYTWMDNGKQVFALLEGTNRLKFPDEIVNAKTDFESLKMKISGIAKNEYIILVFAGIHQSLPPATLTKQMEDELKKICSEKGINLNL